MNGHNTDGKSESTTGNPPFAFGASGLRDAGSEDWAELEKRIQLMFDRFCLAHPNLLMNYSVRLKSRTGWPK